MFSRGMGFPFLFWGGGDGSSEMIRGGQQQPDAGAAGAGAAGAAGMAGGDELGRGLSEEEQIYGHQPGQSGSSQSPQSDAWGEVEQGWRPDGDQVMEDPWQDEGSQGGWFGGDGGGGGDGGSWGDWS